MKKEDLDRYIDNYLAGKATEEEIKLLHEWYGNDLDREDISWDLENESEEELKNRIHESIISQIKVKPSVIKFLNQPYRIVAAIALFTLFTVLFSSRNSKFTLIATSPVGQVENRHVLLPDSSIVIVRPGGELMISNDFGVNDRNVELIGEAYFVVKSNKAKPFVISTGNIKTTVLGTAFSIKANDDLENVEVLVDHGKVRVDKDNELLALLTADHKLVWSKDNLDKEKKVIENIKAVKSIELAWKEEDMHFESLAFGELADRLERRYNVQIIFKNSRLNNCRMSGVFQGTENLEDVLTNLCLTSNTSFSKKADDIYEIEGENCF